MATRIGHLRHQLSVAVVSADTFGTLTTTAETLGISSQRVQTGAEKSELIEQLGPSRCVVIGNGTNDALALEHAALGIAIIGPEGASLTALRNADVLCPSILVALDLLLDTRALIATLRP